MLCIRKVKKLKRAAWEKIKNLDIGEKIKRGKNALKLHKKTRKKGLKMHRFGL